MTVAVRKLLALNMFRKPFSIAIDRDIVSVGDAGMCSICSNCKIDRKCFDDPNVGESVCSMGVRYVRRNLGGLDLTAFGLAPVDSPARRVSALKGRAVPREIVDDWFCELNDAVSTIESAAKAGRADALDAIHDLSRMATELSNLSEDLVKGSVKPGSAIESAPGRHLAIFKAAELLTKEFDRLELLANPASASVGKVYTKIYQLFHKYSLIIDLAFCKGKNCRVVMRGRSEMTIRAYESVSVLAFSLIENAAKYVFSGEEVVVEVNDGVGVVDICVSSIGPLIEEDEKTSIFEPRFRGRWAKKAGVEGRGLGLHLAKIVADAHGTAIWVTSRSLGYDRDDVPAAQTEFRVKLRSL